MKNVGLCSCSLRPRSHLTCQLTHIPIYKVDSSRLQYENVSDDAMQSTKRSGGTVKRSLPQIFSATKFEHQAPKKDECILKKDCYTWIHYHLFLGYNVTSKEDPH